MVKLKNITSITILIAALFYLQPHKMLAQAYTIKLKMKGAEGHHFQFGYYQADNQYVIQNGVFDKNGKAVIEGKEALPPGIYLIAIENGGSFDLLIKNANNLTISAQKSDILNTIKIEGSKENQLFFDYQRQINHFKTELAGLDSSLKSSSDEITLNKLNEQKTKINEEMVRLVNEFRTKHQDSYLAKILKAMESSNPDEIDYADPDLLRTPFYHNMIRFFIRKNINSSPSYIISETSKFLEKIKPTEANYQFAVLYLLNFYNTFYKNGINEVFVFLADNYFLPDKAKWLNNDALSQLKQRRDFLAQGLPGMPAADLTLESTTGEYFSLHQTGSKMTLLYFWSVNCGHCNTSTKILLDHFKELTKKDIKIFAVNIDNDKDQWKKKVEELELPWINCYDPTGVSNYRDKYYVYGSPILFVVSQGKKILAVKNGESEIEDFIRQITN